MATIEAQRQNAANMKPPRKPLTPYMRFSKSIWQSVKVSNPSMSVCEIGATIGKMWRELTDEQKQKFNEDFVAEKAKYDEELAHYLKLTGLQASDLVKSKSKKKEPKNNHNQTSQAPTPPAMMSMPNAQMAAMHHMAPPGYPGNAAGHMMAPPGFSQGVNSSVAGALPHFSQIWASSPYEQNMQMNLMAMSAHQNMMDQRQNGQAHQAFNFGQHPAAAAQEQATSNMSPMYNGSPQMSQSASPHMHNSSPLNSNPQASTPNQDPQHNMQSQYEAMRENGGTNANNQSQHAHQQSSAHNQHGGHNQHGQNPNQQGSQQPPNAHQGGQNPHAQNPNWWPGGHPPNQNAAEQQQRLSTQDQNGHHANGGSNGMSQQSFESQQQQQSQGGPGSAAQSPAAQNSNSRPPSVAASDHMETNPIDKKEDEKPPQVPTPEHKPQSASPGSDSNPGSSDSQKKPDGPVMTTTMGGGTTQSPFPSYPSAHNMFNSFGNFNQPWAQHVANAAAQNRQQPAQGKDGSVFNRESILETELSHLRSALSEKTKEVQRLTLDLEKAHGLIQQLQAEKLQH